MTDTTIYYWLDEEQEMLACEKGDQLVHIPSDPDNSDYREFLNSGATAAPYIAPEPDPEPEPLTTEEKVNHLLSDYGLTRDELRAVLDS